MKSSQLLLKALPFVLVVMSFGINATPEIHPSTLSSVDDHGRSSTIIFVKPSSAEESTPPSIKVSQEAEGTQKAKSDPVPFWATSTINILVVMLGALTAGGFAIWNQSRVAAQGRLLKVLEIIMSSDSGYQADLRVRRLSGFLDNDTIRLLGDFEKKFGGTEYTDVLISVAQAMSTKAQTPSEVLAIWKSVLKEKRYLAEIEYRTEKHRSFRSGINEGNRNRRKGPL